MCSTAFDEVCGPTISPLEPTHSRIHRTTRHSVENSGTIAKVNHTCLRALDVRTMMRHLINLTLLMAIAVSFPSRAAVAAAAYYPPPPGDRWATLSWKEMGWHKQALDQALKQARDYITTGLIILKDGKIVIERYWPMPKGTHYPTDLVQASRHMIYGPTPQGFPVEDVGPVQDSFIAVLAAIANEKGLIDYNDPVDKYLGKQWANVTPAQSREITIRHLMTQTTGLTNSLHYAAKPGTHWRYNPESGQLLLRILSAASGMDANTLMRKWLTYRIGMIHTIWLQRAGTNTKPPTMGLVTTTRDLARFGLLVMRYGRWDGQQIVRRSAIDALVEQGQSPNPDYGMLWWLNAGQPPKSRAGKLVRQTRIPAAPADMLIAADNQLGRYIYVLPAQQIVIVRLGLYNPGTEFTPRRFETDWWKNLAKVFP